jgi:hypothetical protein
MDEERLERLARDIDELKAAVKKNDPLLREILTQKGWILLALGGGLGVSLFALPAHFLSAAYGGFDAIPAPARAALWAALALACVGGGTWKLLLISRRIVEVDRKSSLGDVMESFFGVGSIHVTAGMLVAITAAIAFSSWSGSPWHALPAIGIALGLWMNSVGAQTRVREYLAAGWWSIVSGCAGLFFVPKAPFLWIFIIFAGMFFAFGVSIALSPRRSLSRGRADGGA